MTLSRKGLYSMNEVRKEYKFVYSNSQLIKFFDFYNHNIEKIFPNRVVHSLYLDTMNFKLYYQSLDNDAEKEKLRYRMYNNSNSLYFEKKINSPLGKFKKKEKVDYKSFDEIDWLQYKGFIYTPMLQVSYERQYYSFKNARITVDQKLKFKSTKNRTLNVIEKKLSQNVVEFKLFDNNPDIESLFIDSPVAFSKFCEGTKLIYNL